MLFTKQGINKILRPFCAPASILYGAAARARRYAYNHNLAPSYKAAAPVVSIGNITVGGTGKTPFIRAVADALTARGIRPAVISRGYRGTYTGTRAVSDTHQVLMSPRECGDEPYLLANQLPGVPVIVSRKRAAGAAYACEQFGPDIILLDDGMQHLALQRDLDIVLIDATNPFGNGFTLPCGILREPLAALRTAAVIVLTKTNQQPDTTAVTGHLERLGLADRICTAPFSTPTITNRQDYKTEGITLNKNINYISFSGLGNNESFSRSCRTSIGTPAAHIPFADHHAYTDRDINRINTIAAEQKAEKIITSAKDAARLDATRLIRPLYTLDLTMPCPAPVLDAITALL